MANHAKLTQLLEKTLHLTGTHLYLVRHAQSLANQAGSIIGWTDSKLSVKGREQANQLFRGLYQHANRFTQLHSSDLSRCKDTLNLSLGFPNRHITYDSRLRQMNFGDMEGVHFDSLSVQQKKVVNNIEYQAPNGENWKQARQRAMQYLRQLKSGHHLIYCHGGLICSLGYHLGIKSVIPNCSMVSIELCQKSKQLTKLNFKWQYQE